MAANKTRTPHRDVGNYLGSKHPIIPWLVRHSVPAQTLGPRGRQHQLQTLEQRQQLEDERDSIGIKSTFEYKLSQISIAKVFPSDFYVFFQMCLPILIAPWISMVSGISPLPVFQSFQFVSATGGVWLLLRPPHLGLFYLKSFQVMSCCLNLPDLTLFHVNVSLCHLKSVRLM